MSGKQIDFRSLSPSGQQNARVLSHAEHIAVIRNCILDKARSRGELEILEAGCGRKWPIKLGDIKYSLTGVDIDENALAMRNDLNDVICGDLHSVRLDQSKYDVIYCSYVLEHVKDAQKVLQNFVNWVRDEGVIIIKVPDPQSVYGFLTHHTPFWVHVFYKKYLKGRKNASKPGYGPYPTVYDKVFSRKGIREFCKSTGLVLRQEYKLIPLQTLELLVAIPLHFISLGLLSYDHAGLLYIIEKQQASLLHLPNHTTPAVSDQPEVN